MIFHNYCMRRCLQFTSAYFTRIVLSRSKMSQCENTSYARTHIVWFDMEFTGLDFEKDKILEIGCVITDSNLKPVNENVDIIIHQPESVLRNMNEWCMEHHEKSGLITESLNSKITLQQTEQIILDYLRKYVPKGVCPVAGNSVYMDRVFLQKHMPLVNDYLHYRIIDVSTVKELVRRWYPDLYIALPKKTFKHRAISDINESIKELAFYKENIRLK